MSAVYLYDFFIVAADSLLHDVCGNDYMAKLQYAKNVQMIDLQHSKYLEIHVFFFKLSSLTVDIIYPFS